MWVLQMREQKVALIFFLILCLAFVSFLPAGMVRAETRTIVVPDDFQRISWAIGNATEGDTVFVKSGVYDEVLVIDKSLSLVGENQETTIINGHNKGPVVYIRKDEVNISGFTILNGDTPASRSSSAQYFPYSTRLAGIHILSASHCNVTNNKIMNSGCGIWLVENANYNQIVGNDIINNSNGIKIDKSASNTLRENYIMNSWAGISFSSSSTRNNVLRTNSLVNNSASLRFANIVVHTSFDNDVDESNTINGKPIIFWIDRHYSSVPSDAGYVILVNCTAITVNYSDPNRKLGIIFFNTNSSSISNTNSNVNLVNSNDNTIANNTFSLFTHSSSRNTILDNFGSISLQSAHNNSIIGNSGWIELLAGSFNTIERNNCSGQEGNGIFISGTCIGNSVIRNEISNNEQSGIRLYSGSSGEYYPNGTTILGNNITGNGFVGIEKLGIGFYGIELDFSVNTVIAANNIANNNIGIYTSGSNISYYHNNFINNNQDITNSVIKQNLDNGYPSGGNYWSNYKGTDNDGDGIGDTKYIIGENSQDRYPLIAPITSFDAGTWEWMPFNVDIVSNSTVSDFSFSPESARIQFIADGEEGTTGFCRVTIPKEFLNAQDNWTVLINGTSTNPAVNEDTTNTYLYFTYSHSTKTVEITGTNAIPEFPSWTILGFILVGSLTIILFKKKVWRKF
jgi:parallel beta-helix repeat protein